MSAFSAGDHMADNVEFVYDSVLPEQQVNELYYSDNNASDFKGY